jgi:hypothetical protein
MGKHQGWRNERVDCPLCLRSLTLTYIRQHLLNHGVTDNRKRSLIVGQVMEGARIRLGIRR